MQNIPIYKADIYIPDVCLTVFGPANGRIKLGKLSGIFEIEIRNENFNDEYNLLITDLLIILDGNETSNTKSIISFLWRYPKNSFARIYISHKGEYRINNGFI